MTQGLYAINGVEVQWAEEDTTMFGADAAATTAQVTNHQGHNGDQDMFCDSPKENYTGPTPEVMADELWHHHQPGSNQDDMAVDEARVPSRSDTGPTPVIRDSPSVSSREEAPPILNKRRKPNKRGLKTKTRRPKTRRREEKQSKERELYCGMIELLVGRRQQDVLKTTKLMAQITTLVAENEALEAEKQVLATETQEHLTTITKLWAEIMTVETEKKEVEVEKAELEGEKKELEAEKERLEGENQELQGEKEKRQTVDDTLDRSQFNVDVEKSRNKELEQVAGKLLHTVMEDLKISEEFLEKCKQGLERSTKDLEKSEKDLKDAKENVRELELELENLINSGPLGF